MDTYTTTQGQTWDMVAKEVYNDELKTDVLMQNNPKYIDIFVFSAGTILNVPLIEESESIELPPWRQEE